MKNSIKTLTKKELETLKGGDKIFQIRQSDGTRVRVTKNTYDAIAGTSH